MEDSKTLDHHDEFPNEKIKKETIQKNKIEEKLISNGNLGLNEKKDLKINPTQNICIENNIKTLEDNKSTIAEPTSIKSAETNNKVNEESISKKTTEDIKSTGAEPTSNNSADTNIKDIQEITKDKKLIDNKKIDLTVKPKEEIDKSKNNLKQTSTTIPVKAKTKPVKEPPIEKKPFLEFVNDYLIPEIKNQFKLIGKEVNNINLQKTNRPIAGDICWVIYCEINDTCNFWLSFEKDDITSLKSFSLCKNYEKPSIIESFLIDEKKITLRLIISRILQRLNGQKLIGAN